MKNNKGFTLVELLVVIAILGILLTISAVSVQSILSDSKKKTTEIQDKLIIDAAKAYVLDNLSSCKDGCNVVILTLINGGYLDKPSDNKMLDDKIKIEKDGNSFKYTYEVIN